MLNRFIISFLALALIAVPAAASAALAVEVSGQMTVVDKKTVDKKTVDINMVDMGSLVVFVDGEECHKVEESDCCKTECGCCVAHFFPVSSNIIEPLSFAPVKGALHVDDLAEPTADRLIRPPITV